MFRMINRTTIAFMGVFLIACLVALVYHLFFVWPQQDCDQKGAWWDPRDRECVRPMPIWTFTGRGGAVPAAEAHADAVAASAAAAAPPPVSAAPPKAEPTKAAPAPKKP
jgi:hypothetical protein